MSAIPAIGSPLAQAYSEWENIKNTQRLDEFFDYFTKELNKNKMQINPQKLKEEDWHTFEKILQYVQVEHSQKKKERFANILLNSWDINNSNSYDIKIAFIKAVDDFSDLHIRVLQILNANVDKWIDYKDLKKQSFIKSDIEMISILFDLATRYGFIVRQNNSPAIMIHTYPEGMTMVCQQKITMKGMEFLKYINEDYIAYDNLNENIISS